MEIVMAVNPSCLPAYSILPEPSLLFKGNKTDVHPLRGLSQWGPYSAGIGIPDNIRLAYLAPVKYMQKLENLVSELRNTAIPKEAINYYMPYPGFEKVYHVPLIEPTASLKCAM